MALSLHGGPAAAQEQGCSWQELVEEGTHLQQMDLALLLGFFSFKAQGQRPEVKVTLGKYLTEKREGYRGANRKGYSHIYWETGCRRKTPVGQGSGRRDSKSWKEGTGDKWKKSRGKHKPWGPLKMQERKKKTLGTWERKINALKN